MNIENLNKLIAQLSSIEPRQFSIRYIFTKDGRGSNWTVVDLHSCGTAGCIAGYCLFLNGAKEGDPANAFHAEAWLALDHSAARDLFMPNGWNSKPEQYDLPRVIATLKRLRDTYLSTGQVVVDWGPEPGEEPKQAWTAPQVAEVINPALPAELTSLLRPSLAKMEA